MLKQNPNYPIILWLFTGCFLIYLMVLVGGITRLTNSGLSMVEWSPTGSLPPFTETDWLQQFNKYQQSPEFKIVNADFTLSDFKSIFWWEYIHRFIGRFIGIVFLIPFVYFLAKKKFPQGFTKKMLVLLAIGAIQGFVGWFMVKSGLQKAPHVSHYRLALHLITALTAFGFSFWYAIDLLIPNNKINSIKQIKFQCSLLPHHPHFTNYLWGFCCRIKSRIPFSYLPKNG